ncbi:hypothetical protein VNO78_28998 [Psophocarpus tetragonolobus]|uniref:Cytosolic Fe-S cluster assembly factor NBP35 n=1 Tax=Psophocarpus tetragonolobus TaxID=3891 RepID=A0AAN9X010_PSOTE
MIDTNVAPPNAAAAAAAAAAASPQVLVLLWQVIPVVVYISSATELILRCIIFCAVVSIMGSITWMINLCDCLSYQGVLFEGFFSLRLPTLDVQMDICLDMDQRITSFLRVSSLFIRVEQCSFKIGFGSPKPVFKLLYFFLQLKRRASMENGDIPNNANEHCPGPQSESAGKSDACEGCPNQQICVTAPKGPDPDLVAIAERMATVKHKILVLSGKGGVGKSTFSAQLAFALAARDFQVGLLDVDICGPSIPKMLGLEGQEIHQSNLGWSPVYVESNLGVMSIGFMLPNPDEAVIWRGPRKNGLIKQFLKDVYWGELDFLIVDAPPGTSDEHISIVQCLDATGVDGAIIVTTPQQVSLIDVRKEVNFCKKVGVKVLGVVENMSGLCQPITDFKFMKLTDNGEQQDVTQWVREYLREKAPEMQNLIACSEVFDSSGGGAMKMCNEMGVPFVGRVPLDPQLCKVAEEGTSCFANKDCVVSAAALKKIIEQLIETNGWSMSVNNGA